MRISINTEDTNLVPIFLCIRVDNFDKGVEKLTNSGVPYECYSHIVETCLGFTKINK